jgi:hypothetical protein
MKNLITTFFISMLLAGCISPEQRAEKQMNINGPYCDKMGYQRDTDAWRDCVVNASQVKYKPMQTHCYQSGAQTFCSTY